MKHKYTVEELKEMLYEAEINERIERAKDWERIEKISDKAWKEANVPSTPAERFEKYPPRAVRDAYAYDDAMQEPITYGWEVVYDFIYLFTPMLIAMVILFFAGSM